MAETMHAQQVHFLGADVFLPCYTKSHKALQCTKTLDTT